MTDRHLHCVYFKYDNSNEVKGRCLLKNKEITFGFNPCCEFNVLRPSVLLSYYIKNPDMSWGTANEITNDFLENNKFNDYPKGNEKE